MRPIADHRRYLLCSVNSTLRRAFPLRLRSWSMRLLEYGHEADPAANCCEDLLETSELIQSALARGEISVAHWE